MDVVGVRMEAPGRTQLLLLRERSGLRRVLPIYIGEPEADSIQKGLAGRVPPRPLTHDLVVDLLGALGADIDRVVITDVDEGIFLAELRLRTRTGSVSVSARPSDAVAIAVRSGCEIWCETDVLDSAGRIVQERDDEDETDDESDDDLTDVDPGGDVDVDEIMGEFRDFIEGIKPEDFAP